MRSEIEKHFKANSAENEVNDAIKSIVAAANNNGEADGETDATKDNKDLAGASTQITNGEKDAETAVASS